jgi:anion-transporting  ArsA/GET3 family ATPase
MAELHIVTGKGGVGKSTVAAALALRFAREGRGPVLLVDIQGSGWALRLHGLNGAPFENTPLPLLPGGYGSRLLPKETFKQYFGLLLALGNENSTFAAATGIVRSRIVDLAVENKVVSAFIDVCPGLEPAVLLGKIHWEAWKGGSPSENEPWAHVVVDAPATGHGVMLFKSMAALVDVFGAGIIFRQASEIMDFVRNPRSTKLWLTTLPEELPVAESLEMQRELAALRVPIYRTVLNRCSPVVPGAEAPASTGPWVSEIGYESERAREQSVFEETLRKGIGAPLTKVGEFSGDPTAALDRVAQELFA